MNIKQFFRVTILLTTIFLLFFNCSSSTDSNETNATVEGTMTLPAVADGKTYSIVIDNDDDGLNGFIRLGTGVCGSSLAVEYSVKDVPEGDYYISAVVYVVSVPGMIPTSGDYGGFYGSDSIPTSPNASVAAEGTANFDFDLTIVP